MLNYQRVDVEYSDMATEHHPSSSMMFLQHAHLVHFGIYQLAMFDDGG